MSEPADELAKHRRMVRNLRAVRHRRANENTFGGLGWTDWAVDADFSAQVNAPTGAGYVVMIGHDSVTLGCGCSLQWGDGTPTLLPCEQHNVEPWAHS